MIDRMDGWDLQGNDKSGMLVWYKDYKKEVDELKQAVSDLKNENSAMQSWFKANGLVFEKVMQEGGGDE